MDTTAFDQQIADLTSSLGDPTRRGIYITIRESDAPLTASEIAELFDIHPNVARHHLDRLTQDGYLTVSTRRPSSDKGPGAGRPAKCYVASNKQIELRFPGRRGNLLFELLLRMIGEIADPLEAAAVATEVGRAYGRELAGELGESGEEGYVEAVTALAKAMGSVGFNMNADPDSDQQLLTRGCPFGEMAISHPAVICSLDQGIISGIVEVLEPSMRPEVIPHGHPEACVTRVEFTGRKR
ncbi:MAG: helix-turn-helix domain-containing protein [Acidimicrobiia bacterium]|nr:helix-turn-helix domain-containing protein [Acidimicrobiia bacterium]